MLPQAHQPPEAMGLRMLLLLLPLDSEVGCARCLLRGAGEPNPLYSGSHSAPTPLVFYEVQAQDATARRREDGDKIHAFIEENVPGRHAAINQLMQREILRSRCRLFWNHTCTCRGDTLSCFASSLLASSPGNGSSV